MSKDKKISKPDENPSKEKEDMLAFMAKRAAGRNFYLASALESFKRAEKLDETGLLKYLEIPPEQLSRLALCGRPEVTDNVNFIKDVKAIAQKFNIKLALLARLLRLAAAFEATQEETPLNNSYLMAALDRERDVEKEKSPDLDEGTTKDD